MAEWFEDQGFLKGLDHPKAVPPPSSGPAPSGTVSGDWTSDTNFLKSLDGPQLVQEEPSYLSKLGAAAKVGLKSGLAGAMKMYEIPTRTLLEKTELGAPGTFASEQLTPTKEEEEAGAKAGIPGEIVKGAAGIPGAFAKYAPLMAVAPAGIIGTALTFAGEQAAEDLAAGKKVDPLEIAEQAAIGAVFKGIEPLGRAAKAAILGGTFSTQAFAHTLAETKDIAASLKAGIAPAVVGAGMGLMGGGKPEERPIPRPGEEGIRQIPTIPESRYQMGTPGYPRPEELPYPIVPYKPGGPMVDTGEFFGYRTVPPRPEVTRGLGWTSTGTPPPQPDWVREGREWPPPQYPPDIYRPGAPGVSLKPEIPPTPTPTPSETGKPPEAPVRPPTDRQMASVRDNAGKVGGLSVDLIKRWTGLGTKRANAILEDLVNKGEIEGGEPGDPYPWKLKAPTAPKPMETGFIPGTYKDKLAKDFNETINKRFDDEGARELHREIASLYFAVEAGQPGKRIMFDAKRPGEGSNVDVIGEPSSYPEFISKNNLTRKDTLRALEKGLKGEKLGKRESEIFNKARTEAKESIEQRRAEEVFDKQSYEILTRNLSEEGTQNDLTKHLDDEIMGLKEELRESHSNDEIDSAIKEATKTLAGEGAPPEIQRVEQEIRSLLNPKPIEPSLSPTAKDQFALPGIRQGLEMAGAKEGAAPTLEGTPLGEAARKAEMERVQPGLFVTPKEVEEAPPYKVPLTDFQATPEKFIPDDLTVDVKAIREKTGKEVTMKQNAKEAFSEITDRLKKFRDFMDCVRS